MTDSFNNFFLSIAGNIDNKIIHANSNHKDYLENSVSNQFILFKPTSEEEVTSIIKQMKTNKALGTNSIPTKILKLSQQIIAKPLVYLFSLSFSKGVFPNLLKIAIIIPVFKKDSQDYNK